MASADLPGFRATSSVPSTFALSRNTQLPGAARPLPMARPMARPVARAQPVLAATPPDWRLH